MHEEKIVLKNFERPLARGRLRYTVYRKGKPIEYFKDNNLIVNSGRTTLAVLLAESPIYLHIDRIAVGINGDIETLSDTVITNCFEKNIDGHSFPATGQVQFNWKLSEQEANGMAIREFGLLTADGALFARRTRDSPLNKESDISITGDWTIILA